MKLRVGCVFAAFLSMLLSMAAQTAGSSVASAQVPPVIQFSNVAVDPAGNPLTGTVPITFSLYNNAQGGQALWTETQSVTLDSSGHYSVYLGITKTKGLPVALFTTGQALWLGVQVAGETEQPRVALVSVPYAMKAGDAATVGGLPPSAFAKADSQNGPSSGNKAKAGIETQSYIPLFIDGSGDLGNSILYQSGTTAVGIGTTTPSATLEVNGTAKFDNLVGFASGQTFPGTLTGIKAGTGISVTGSTTDPTVGINTTFANEFYAQLKAANTFSASQTVIGTMTATNFSGNGSGLTDLQGGNVQGAVATATNALNLGGLPPSSYQPAGSYATTGANSFSGNQSVTGSVSATGSISGTTGTFTGLVTESGALLPATGTATATQGYNSNAMDMIASAYNSTAGAAQNQDFQWLVAPSGNDTSSPSGTLTLLFGQNGAPPTPTGLSVASNGQITFTANQSFPNTGTITGVTAGTGLSGGGTSGSVTLSNTGILSLTAGTGITVGSGQMPAIAINTSVVPQLNAANIFTGTQTVNGNLSVATGDSFNIGSNAFAFGSYSAQSSYLGFAGNRTATGTENTAVGFQALALNSTGNYNTAVGEGALSSSTSTYSNTAVGESALGDTTGGYNTAVGTGALGSNTTGAYNTAVGIATGQFVGSSLGNSNTFIGSFATGQAIANLTNATAIGAYAEVAENNALVLGGVTGVNNGTSVNVGIGTTKPQFTLDVNGSINTATGLNFGGVPFDSGFYLSGNAFLGFGGNSTTSGSGVTAAGFQALYSNTFGSNNTASGFQALYSNVGGGDNTAVGASTLYSNTGSYNTATGVNALTTNTTGSYNEADGAEALQYNVSGSYNTAAGFSALYNNFNNYNTGVGYQAGQALNGASLSNNNSFLGANAAASALSAITNASAIGANAEVTANNALVLGSINGVNGATASVNVGIGTTTPQYTLHVVDNGTGGVSGFSNVVGHSAVYGQNTANSGVGTNGGTFYTSSAQGSAVVGVNQASGGLAAYFEGNVTVTGTLSKGGGSFKIDHPLDPANKYLYHSFVESPDMMDIYNGVAKLDARGSAWITLPTYFEALNRDFRYQLTSIGRPQPSLYIAREISGNRFRISGGKAGGKVSWQVTGIRQDAYADAHRIPVEEDKPEQEQGHYLHPELFGAPPEMAIGPQPPSLPTVAKAAPEGAGAGAR